MFVYFNEFSKISVTSAFFSDILTALNRMEADVLYMRPRGLLLLHQMEPDNKEK